MSPRNTGGPQGRGYSEKRAGTDNTDQEMIQEESSGEIIGAGMDLLNELRPGLDDHAPGGLRTQVPRNGGRQFAHETH
jgi:hypothetical protein